MLNIKRYIKAYTLIETALALSLLAVIFGAVMVYITSTQTSSVSYFGDMKTNLTVSRIEVIDEALANFVKTNNYYPCPANPSNTRGSPNYGVAAPFNTGNFGCDANPTNLTDQAGVLPFKTLGISEEYMKDGWDRPFTYRIATGMGSATTYLNPVNFGDIQVYDMTGLELTRTFEDNESRSGAAYVIISHGFDGRGALASESYSVPKGGDVNFPDFQNTTRGTANQSRYIQSSNYDVFGDVVRFRLKSDLARENIQYAGTRILPETVCNDARLIAQNMTTTATPELGKFRLQLKFSGPDPDEAAIVLRAAQQLAKVCDNIPIQTYNQCNLNPGNMGIPIRLWVDFFDPFNTGTPPAEGTNLFLTPYIQAKIGNNRLVLGGGNLMSYTYNTPFSFYNSNGVRVARSAAYVNNNQENFSTIYGTSGTPTDSIFNYTPSSTVCDAKGCTTIPANYTQTKLGMFMVIAPHPSNYLSVLTPFSNNYKTQFGLYANGPSYQTSANKWPSAVFNASNTTAHSALRVLGPYNRVNAQPMIVSVALNDVSQGYDSMPYYSSLLRVRTMDGQVYYSGTQTAKQFEASESYFFGSMTLYGNTIPYRGWIGEYILVDHTNLTPEQHDLIESYLVKKWFTGECR